jgi:hypothetical protein
MSELRNLFYFIAFIPVTFQLACLSNCLFASLLDCLQVSLPAFLPACFPA